MIEAVEIAAPDGAVLRGELRRAGPVWVVLAHAPGEDLDAWAPLPAALAAHGFAVLAFDLRGHGGSGGVVDAGRGAGDLGAAVEFARAAGAERVVVGAAGESVAPALAAAAEHGVSGFVALGPRGTELPRVAGFPRLVLAASRDPDQDSAATALGRSGQAVVIRLPVRDVLRDSWRTNAEAYVLRFLDDLVRREEAVTR